MPIHIRGMQKSGFVYLVGAGPGDPELITLAGRNALLRAEAVVYDKLVDPRLLDLAPPTAERVYVGKQAGSTVHCTPQAFINSKLIELAGQGKCIVRLKGGDPILFARGAEEAAALREAGVPFAIIPGVTAALASAATAAIPLTHRAMASAVAFITGHEDPEKTDRLNWDHFAQFPGTLVIYMALQRIGSIARRLQRGGMDPATTVSLVEWGGTNRQRVVSFPLSELAADVPVDLHSPTLAIVGPVCSLRESLRWFEKRPLFGESILIMRAKDQAAEPCRQLEQLGATVWQQPAFRIEPPADWEAVDQAIDRLAEFDWVVFSSPNGVQQFIRRLLERGGDMRAFGGCRLAAIGPGTAAALAEFHLKADLVPPEFQAESLAKELLKEVEGERILLVRANRGRTVLRDELSGQAAEVASVVSYNQVDVTEPDPAILEQLRDGSIDWVFLSSSNMARSFFRWLDDDLRSLVKSQVRLVSISPVTSQSVREEGFDVTLEATTYNFDGMIEVLLKSLVGKNG